MGKFCSKCGSQLNENDKFCLFCGSPVANIASQNPNQPVNSVIGEPPFQNSNQMPFYTPAEQQQFFAPAEQPISKPKSKKKALLLSVIAVFVAISLIISAAILSDDSDKTSSAKTGATEKSDSYQDEDDTYQDDDYTAQGNSIASQNNAPLSQNGKQNISRTVMIYMVASDLESQHGAASLDFTEICESDFDRKKTNVVIYAGGTKEWQNNTMTDRQNGIYIVEDNQLKELKNVGSQNMGSSNTLSSFLEYCEGNYQSDRYNLILWNHGGGPIFGFGLDEVNYDYLTMDELSTALKNSPFSKNNKLETIGFDACLMGSVETAWVFKDYAEYFIASQESEPGYGWNYEFLEQLIYCRNGADIGRAVIDSYFDFYEDLYDKKPRLESDLTLSCVNLSKIGKVEEGIENLFSGINSEVAKGKINNVSRCRYRTKAFGKFGATSQYDLIDLKHMTSLLSSDYKKEAEKLESALNEYITYSRSNVKNANGVSIYHPYDDLDAVNTSVNVLNKIGFASGYAEYIKNFSDAVENDTTSSTTYRDFSKTAGNSSIKDQQSDISIKLTPEQAETFSGAKYYVFKKLEGDETFSEDVEYLHIFTGKDTELSQDGTLSATYQGKAIFGKDSTTGEYSDFPLPMYQIYDGSGSEKYYMPCMFSYFDGLSNYEFKPVNWLMKFKNGVPTLLGAYSMTDDTEKTFPDKFLIDSQNYELYEFANNAYTIQYDSNGNIEFVFTGSSYGFGYNRENGFSLEMKPVDYSEGYYAVFIIEDIYGNTYTSSFIDLAK